MNKMLVAWLSAMISALGIARGQGTFQNLDFEAAKITFVNNSLYDVAATNALPGWAAFSGPNQLSIIPYNDPRIIPKVGLYGSNTVVISGNFSVFLGGGSISQTGLVPANAKSLLFTASNPFSNRPPLDVSLDSQSLPYTALFTYPHHTLYGADIAAFAGETAVLSYSGHGYRVDGIEFSDQIVPEPAASALLALGVCYMAVQLIRNRRWKPSSPRKSDG